MIGWLKLFFNRDITIESRDWLIQTMQLLSYGAIISTVILGIATFFLDRGFASLFSLVVISLGVELFCLYLFKQGRVYLGAIIIISFLWAVFSIDLMFFTGIRGMSVYGQLLTIFMIGYILHSNAALFLSGATILIDFLVFYREYIGYEVIAGIEGVTWARWIITTVFIAMFGLFVRVAMRRLENVLARNMESLGQYQSLFEHTTDAVIILDSDLNIQMVNKSSQIIFGYSEEQLVSRPIFEFTPGKYHPFIKKFLPWMQRGRDVPIFEMDLVVKNDREVTVEGDITFVVDKQNEPLHIQLILRDITMRKRQMQELEASVFYDPLTGIGNRKMFTQKFSEAMEAADKSGNYVVLFFVDLNDFKKINDTYGHIAGDELLREVAQRLRMISLENMTVTRLGGDEFAVFIDDVEILDDALDFGYRIVEQVVRPMVRRGQEFVVGCSVGSSVYPSEGNSFTNMLELADYAMYQVKAAGVSFQRQKI